MDKRNKRSVKKEKKVGRNAKQKKMDGSKRKQTIDILLINF